MIKFLKKIDFSDEQCFESLGQILDSLAQVLEKVEHHITNKPSVTRSFGELESFLRQNNLNELAESLNLIRTKRKEVNIRKPEKHKVEELRNLVIDFIKKTDYTNLEHELRIRYLPKLENSTGVESNVGFSHFNLYHGSISHVDCNTLIISANLESDKLDGQVINALKWRFKLPTKSTNKFFISDSMEVCYLDTKESDTLFDNLIVLSIANEEKILDEIQSKNYFLNLFACLNQCEYLGLNLEVVGLSFLFGNRVSNKINVAKNLIFESLMWLKQSKTTTSINCALLHKSELELWNRTMNQVLNRSLVDSQSDSIVYALKIELLTSLEKHKKSNLSHAILPLISALSSKDGVNIELVCTFSRTLCELIVMDITKYFKLKSSGDLLSSIERLRTEGVVSPWISSYMHGIRILGNKSVHPPKNKPKYYPAKLSISDLSSALIGVKSLLDFWESNKLNIIE